MTPPEAIGVIITLKDLIWIPTIAVTLTGVWRNLKLRVQSLELGKGDNSAIQDLRNDLKKDIAVINIILARIETLLKERSSG